MAIKYDKNGRPYEEVEDPAALIDAGRAAGLRQAAQAPATGLGQERPSSGTGRQVAVPTGAQNGAGATQQPISYENAGSYLSANQAAIDELRGRILGRGAFDYDYTTDPRWQAYRKEYVREGQRAAADTLGQASALTGGRPSTAAITASQQAGNYYAAQLADKIPELYAAAYDVWQDADSRDRANLGLLLDEENTAYERAWNEDERDYKRGIYADETAYNRGQQSWENNLALAKLAASYGDFSMLRRLGFDDAQIASIAAGYQAQQAGSGGSGSGGSSRRSGSSGEDALRAAAEEATDGTLSAKAAARSLLDDNVLAELLNQFPDGFIDDADTWRALTEEFDIPEEILNAAGFRNGNDPKAKRYTDEDVEDMRAGRISWTGRMNEAPDSGTGTPGIYDFGGDYNRALASMISRGVTSQKAGEVLTLEEYMDEVQKGGAAAFPGVLSRDEFTTRAQRRDPSLTVYGNYEGYLESAYADYLDYMAREYVRLYGGL